MKQKVLFVLFLLLVSSYSFAQKENTVWYFGKNAGMDFRNLQTYNNATVNGVVGQTVSGIPKFVTGPISTLEGCFSLCDKDGNFLMASDGSTVYNGALSTDVMENGTGLYGNSSSTQSGVFVPRPGHPNQYYVITGTATENPPSYGLNYSIIDMSENSGKGKVLEKNKPLDFGGARIETDGTGALIDRLKAYEGIAVYPHADGVNYWMVNRTRDKFFTWLIDGNGIGPSPVSVTQANEDGGGLYQDVTTAGNYAGIMMSKFSMDGTLLANSFTYAYRDIPGNIRTYLNTYLIVCKFDNSTGKISDVTSRNTTVPANQSQNYGIEFSPNNEYLYHCIYPQVNTTAQIWKIPKANFFTDLAGSAVLSTSIFNASNIGIGPDNRLYCVGYNQRDLVIFENPDEGATSWIKIPNYFTATNIPQLGLPNFVYSFFGIGNMDVIPQNPCVSKPVNVSIQVSAGTGPNAVTKIEWNFGDGSAIVTDTDMNQLIFSQQHVYTQAGSYTITITPYKADNSVVTEKIQTLALNVGLCDLPDNFEDAMCYVTPPASNWAIKEALPINKKIINNYGLRMVGDLDNDGKLEIITHGVNDPDLWGTTSLEVFYYDNGALKHKKTIQTVDNDNRGSSATVRYNDIGYIIVPGRDGYLYAYDIDNSSTYLWRSSTRYNTKTYVNTTHTTANATNVGIADFNNDGIPEIYAGNKIYSLVDGTLICDGLTNNKGIYLYNIEIFSTYAVDFDGDGKLELLAGTQIYDVDIDNKTMSLKTGWQLPTGQLPANTLADGQASPVDIDNDGVLEVAVISANGTYGTTLLVWKPQPNNQSVLVGYFNIAGTGNHSTPMIGNIDDAKTNPNPEIIFITNHLVGGKRYMYALRYDGTKAMGKRITEKWRMDHSDTSGATGATLFDFNQSGTAEIVYRDETTLRIFDGSGSAAVEKSRFENVLSGTVREYPVVADIDGDGQAEIIITGWDGVAYTNNGIIASNVNGYLRIFKAGDNASWAPARSVWNQYMYNPVNVNKDLTIPHYQFNQATLFPGENGIFGDNDDVRPFNNMLQQQTVLNKDGYPLWVTPKGEIVDTPVFSYNQVAGTMQVTVKVKNSGDAIFRNPFYVTIYKNNIGNSTKYTHEYQNEIAVGETATITFTVPNYTTDWAPFGSIVLNINDKGNGDIDQEVCGSELARYDYNDPVLPDNIIDADCYISPPVQDWSIAYSKSTAMAYSPYQNVVVGNIDDDDIVEIIVCGNPLTPSPVANRNSNQIVIFKGNNISTPYKTITTKQPYSWDAYTKYGIVRTTINGKEKVLIVVAERDLYMRAYDPNSATPNTPVWTSSEVYHSASNNVVTMSFADLNRDGIPEVMIAGKIFNSTNGQLLCKTAIEFTSATYFISIPLAEDIFRDGTIRFIQGNMIYKPNAALSSLTLEKTIAPTPSTSDTDNPGGLALPNGGRVSLVDMDLDGQLDLVISTRSTSNTAYAFIYIADPVTGDIKASKVIPNASNSSYPFVGDIDGDGYPEIVFIKCVGGVANAATRKMYAYKYVPGNPVLQKFWELDHSDDSGSTSMTLFDFNQDGISEIIYRDETHMRIINGSLKHHQTGLPVAVPYNLAEIKCSSGTSTEYPVVADIDGDGQAEIVIVGGNDRTVDPYHLGHLWVFKSGNPVDSPWAPARKVWNQFAYNSLNINEDLTVPQYNLNPATVFPGYDGVLGTSDDVRPFNNFLQQQTMLSKNGNPLWLTPKAEIVNVPTFIYNDVTDKMTITVEVKNGGDVAFQAPFYVTVHKDVVPGAKQYIYTYNNPIAVNETVTMIIVLDNFETDWAPYSNLIVKINDKGDGFDDQLVCGNNKTQYDYRGIIPTQQDVCLNQVVAMTCNFVLPNGSNTYQWQSSPDNWSWADISGATAITYTPIGHIPGIIYYRVVVSDGVDTANSVSVRVRVKSCRLPVNHNISIMEY